MDELSRKLRTFDWKGLQKSARKVQASTASALKDLVMTDLENKVRAATSDTSWGASGSDLMLIAQGTFNREDYALIMSIVWQRLGSSRWRCVYKALEVLRYLIMHGAQRCTEEARAASHHIQTLQHFRFVDPKTRRDHGEGVRMRAKLLCDMLADQSVLEEEREKSKELRAKLQGGVNMPGGGRMGGVSSEDYQYGYGSGNGLHSEPGVTRTSTGGAGQFKGYGGDEGGYDDVPTGMFAKKAAAENGTAVQPGDHVPDLLGDVADGNGLNDDDDDDFDPRGHGQVTETTANTQEDDFFGALALTDVGVGNGAGTTIQHGSANQGTSGMKTSELIQSLAQKRVEEQGGAAGMLQVARVNEVAHVGDGLGVNGFDGSGFDALGSTPTMGTGMGFGGNTGSMGAASKPVVLSSKKEVDPFADLVDSAKKTGVL